jgi:hypothetical protein
MRFLANENFPGTTVTALAAAGHDVVWMRIAAPGMSDADVLAWAARDGRILLTFDKDFGELARASALPSTCGVVLFPCCQSLAMLASGSPTWSRRVTIGPAISLSSSPAAFGCAPSGSAQPVYGDAGRPCHHKMQRT